MAVCGTFTDQDPSVLPYTKTHKTGNVLVWVRRT